MAEAAAEAAPAEGAATDESQTASQQALNMLAGDTATGTSQTPTAKDTGPEPASTQQPSHDDADQQGHDEEPEDLGPAGKRAIERMKTERSSAIRAQKKAESALAECETKLAAANKTIRQLRIKDLAAGKLRDTSLALKLLTDLNGDEDDKTITKAIDKLVSDYPYLAPESNSQQQPDDDPDMLRSLFPAGTLKPADQHQVSAAQFGGILDQLGISI